MKVTKGGKMSLKFDRLEERTHRNATRVMARATKAIAERAAAYAPKDKGDLEKAIEHKVIPRQGSNRESWEVKVNTRRLGQGYRKYKFRYDIEVHDNQELKLGKKSQEKADETGFDVGPLYLVRALWDYEEQIQTDMENALRKVGLWL